MTHMEFIRNNFTVLAETANAIFFDAYGEKVAEINGQPFNCNSVEEFHELLEFWGDETFEEQSPLFSYMAGAARTVFARRISIIPHGTSFVKRFLRKKYFYFFS